MSLPRACDRCGNTTLSPATYGYYRVTPRDAEVVACSESCARRSALPLQAVGAPLTATPSTPLPPGLYVQGDTPNTWFRANELQRDLIREAAGNEYAERREGDKLYQAYTGYVRMSNKATGSTVERRVWEQPAVPMPPGHSGAPTVPYQPQSHNDWLQQRRGGGM